MFEAKEFEFSAIMWLWHGGKAAWSFISLPQDISDEIYFANKLRLMGNARGFGSVKVRAFIGKSSWETSIFPSNETKCYILPVKKTIRLDEGLGYEKEIPIKIKII